MARPGIMLYFDLLGPIRALSDADKGRLLVAMLEYGRDGIVPEFDGMLAFAWEFVKPKLDKDGASYENVKLQRKYAAYCKRRSAENLPKITFDEWLHTPHSGNDSQRATTGVNENNDPLRAVTGACNRVLPLPTTTTTRTTTTTTATTTTPTTTTWDEGALVEDFEQLWQMYPAERRGDKKVAFDAFRQELLAPEEAAAAIRRLKLWKQSAQWAKAGGQYIPYLHNWILRGIWTTEPAKTEIPKGASGVLGEAELDAIRRVLAEEDNEEEILC